MSLVFKTLLNDKLYLKYFYFHEQINFILIQRSCHSCRGADTRDLLCPYYRRNAESANGFIVLDEGVFKGTRKKAGLTLFSIEDSI